MTTRMVKVGLTATRRNDITEKEMIEYINTVSLVDALWWFIENVNEDTPGRTALFFRLRERVRESRT